MNSRTSCPGQEVLEFIRANPHWGGVSCGETADGLAEVLSDSFLGALCNRNGFSILYTHLGKYKKGSLPFNPAAIKALGRLAFYSHSGKILITTTNRLLRYCSTIEDINFSVSQTNDVTEIDISFTNATTDLSGLTFYVANPERTRILINGHILTEYNRNLADQTGRKSISIPWKPLRFPTL